MKKFLHSGIAAVVFLILILLLTGCRKDPPLPVVNPSAQEQPGQIPSDGEPSGSDQEPDDPSISGPDIYSVSPAVLSRMLTAVSGFRVAPQAFDNVSELTDATLLFAGACSASANFIPTADGYSYALSLSDLEDSIEQVFGPDAALSSGYLSGDYSPFYFDGDKIYRDSLGNPAYYTYTLSVVSLGDNRWELQELDLTDPLFWDTNANGEFLESGGTVDWAMVEPLKDQLTTYVYTLREVGNRFMIESFRFINYRESGTVSY